MDEYISTYIYISKYIYIYIYILSTKPYVPEIVFVVLLLLSHHVP